VTGSSGDESGASAGKDSNGGERWAHDALAWEVDRAADPLASGPEVRSTARLSQISRDLQRRLRADQLAPLPLDEPILSTGAPWKRFIKRLMYRFLRPISRRYDRVAADLATVEASLAQRIEQFEGRATGPGRLQSDPSSASRPDAVPSVSVERLAAADEADRARTAGARRPSGSGSADDFYWFFEATMRGSAELIASRLSAYEDRVQGLKARAEPSGSPLWLDVGCGQGQFGELLTDWGWRFQGVDDSARAVEACRTRGLDAVQEDLLDYLDRYGGEAPLGVSAIQVIEHLPKDLWLAFFLGSRKVLRPGGALLVETINPLNPQALVGSFFTDLTHTWPPHPETLRLLARFAGFSEIEIAFLNTDDAGSAQDYARWAVTPS
jgi:SAM-dependent methyltransferase